MTTWDVHRLHRLVYFAALLSIILILAVAGASAASPLVPPGPSGSASASPAGLPAVVQAATATGPLLSYQGRLADPATGNPKSGTFAMTFRLYNVSSGGAALWTETKNVNVAVGLFNTLLGDTTALNPAHFDGSDLWLGVQIAPDTLEAAPRIPVAYAPYALFSSNAAKLGGQLPGAYAAATHGHDAANIVSGNLSTDRYHAADDLAAEDLLGNASGDIALNNGVLQPTLNADLLDGQQAAAFAPTTHNHAGEQITSGTVADARVASTIARDAEIMPAVLAADGAGSTLDADLLDGQHAAAFSTAGHNHLGEVWSLSTNSDGLLLGGSVGWANSLFRAFNHSSGPSIWGVNDGGGNGVRGQGTGDSLGVYGQAENAAGVAGRSSGNDGVAGVSSAAGRSGVFGNHEGAGNGVSGQAEYGPGLYGKDGGPNPDDSWAVVAEGDMRTSGDLNVGLTLYVGGLATFAGGKSGFVVDIAQNDDTEPLMPGDVVSISGAGQAMLGEIPVIKVRRATAATAAGVMGVVDGRFTIAARARTSGAEGVAQGKMETRVEAVVVDPGQSLTVVTLGAYKAIKVDAAHGPILPGDLLVASPNPGYAMRSTAPLPGTIIGKSLGSLAEGTGVVPVLVTLQ